MKDLSKKTLWGHWMITALRYSLIAPGLYSYLMPSLSDSIVRRINRTAGIAVINDISEVIQLD